MNKTVSSSTQLQAFDFDNVSTGQRLALSAMERDGQAWFVAADVCKALGIKNSRDALSSLDADEKGVATTDTLGGTQQVAIINESGLYSLIFRSRKESAKQFKKWITSVVIPSIRKHGGYINGMETLPEDAQQETLATIQEAAARARARHLEEKEARREGLRFMRRGW